MLLFNINRTLKQSNEEKEMNATYLTVAVGDLVLIQFESKNVEMRVTKIERRYGKIAGGTKSQNPLIIGRNTHTQQREIFDAVFVTKILERDYTKTVYPKQNHFRGDLGLRSFKQNGNRWTGTLTALVAYALGKLPYEFDRPLHERRVRQLYQKSALGKKSRNTFLEEVDGRLFQRWVAKNYTRLVMSSEEYDEFQTLQLIQMEKQMEKDLEFWMGMDEKEWLFTK